MAGEGGRGVNTRAETTERLIGHGRVLGERVKEGPEDIIRVTQRYRGSFQPALMLEGGDQRVGKFQRLRSLDRRGGDSMSIGSQPPQISLNSTEGDSRERVGRIHSGTSKLFNSIGIGNDSAGQNLTLIRHSDEEKSLSRVGFHIISLA